MILRSKAVLLALAAVVFSANGGVVINEIFYHAPDDIDDLEYVELHNPGDQPVDLSGWRFTKGIQFQFPPGTKIEASGYLVICRNLDRFKEFYGFAAQGNFDQPLSNSGERIELVNARGETVDRVKYKSRSPWPVAPDGYSSSLERISPAAARPRSRWTGPGPPAHRANRTPIFPPICRPSSRTLNSVPRIRRRTSR